MSDTLHLVTGAAHTHDMSQTSHAVTDTTHAFEMVLIRNETIAKVNC